VSEAEFLEMLNLHATSAMNAFSIYLTLTFAFLTAIYLIGAKLTKPQSLMIFILYSFWAVSFTLVAVTHLQSLESLVDNYSNFVPTRMWLTPWAPIGGTICAAGILISCYFIVDVRRGARTDLRGGLN
jgi:hypothetical protein